MNNFNPIDFVWSNYWIFSLIIFSVILFAFPDAPTGERIVYGLICGAVFPAFLALAMELLGFALFIVFWLGIAGAIIYILYLIAQIP